MQPNNIETVGSNRMIQTLSSGFSVSNVVNDSCNRNDSRSMISSSVVGNNNKDALDRPDHWGRTTRTKRTSIESGKANGRNDNSRKSLPLMGKEKQTSKKASTLRAGIPLLQPTFSSRASTVKNVTPTKPSISFQQSWMSSLNSNSNHHKGRLLSNNNSNDQRNTNCIEEDIITCDFPEKEELRASYSESFNPQSGLLATTTSTTASITTTPAALEAAFNAGRESVIQSTGTINNNNNNYSSNYGSNKNYNRNSSSSGGKHPVGAPGSLLLKLQKIIRTAESDECRLLNFPSTHSSASKDPLDPRNRWTVKYEGTIIRDLGILLPYRAALMKIDDIEDKEFAVRSNNCGHTDESNIVDDNNNNHDNSNGSRKNGLQLLSIGRLMVVLFKADACLGSERKLDEQSAVRIFNPIVLAFPLLFHQDNNPLSALLTPALVEELGHDVNYDSVICSQFWEKIK